MKTNGAASKCGVLVVDDEPLIAGSLVQILNLFAYEATVAYDPTQAIEFIRTHGPCEVAIPML